jgi:Mn-dependent DtxR family transcriptional regulator
MRYLTSSLEDYLEIIYILKQDADCVGITDIAHALSVSKPGVNKAINTLKLGGFVFQEKYGKIILTDKGESAAMSVYEKHKILSEFLSDVLGVSSKTAEIDACKIEHILSRETLIGIERFLNDKKSKQQ